MEKKKKDKQTNAYLTSRPTQVIFVNFAFQVDKVSLKKKKTKKQKTKKVDKRVTWITWLNWSYIGRDTNILMSRCYRSYKHFQLWTNLPLLSWWANHAEYSMGLAHKRQQSHKNGFQVNLLLYACFNVNIFFEIEIFKKKNSNFLIFCSDFKMS